MRRVNATVQEFGGLPYPAEYLATRRSDGKYYMEVRHGRSQSRKWLRPKDVTFKEDITHVYIEKAGELRDLVLHVRTG